MGAPLRCDDRLTHGLTRPLWAAYDARVLELVYTGLLVVIFGVIGWFACYVVYKLYQGQR